MTHWKLRFWEAGWRPQSQPQAAAAAAAAAQRRHEQHRTPAMTEGPVSLAEARVLRRTERSMLIGLLPGALGGLIAGLLGSGIVAPGLDRGTVAACWTMVGAAAGLLLGSFYGLTPTEVTPGLQSAPRLTGQWRDRCNRLA